MQYFGYSVNIIFVIVALLLFQRIFLFHVQFVNGMNTSYVQIRNELASEQLIKVQFQVAMSGRYNFIYEIESASISANYQIEYVFCFVIIMLDPF